MCRAYPTRGAAWQRRCFEPGAEQSGHLLGQPQERLCGDFVGLVEMAAFLRVLVVERVRAGTFSGPGFRAMRGVGAAADMLVADREQVARD